MQTYSAESIPSQWPILLNKVARGEEILITEKEQPVARLVPVDSEQLLLRELEAFDKSARKTSLATKPEESSFIPVTPESYPVQIRALRGFVPGIDTDVEREDDPA